MEKIKYSVKDFHNGQLPNNERELISVLNEELVTLSRQLMLITKKVGILTGTVEAIRSVYDEDYKNIPNAKEGYSNIITMPPEDKKPCGCKDNK